ncbi:MAG: ATP-dependent Clp protease proteolytic subunit [Parvularculaceae bacterium]
MTNFSLTDLLWLFLILATIQPVISRRMLDAMRMRKIAEIEKKRGSRVILMVYRQETMNLLGFPIMRFIDMNDSEAVLRAIHMTDPEAPIDIVLHTPGGLALAAIQIARAIKAHKGKISVFVPHMAMSGGTLIALAADEIVMCEHSMLGPIDPQINGMPAASLIYVAETKPIGEVDDQTLMSADIARKSTRQIERAATELLVEHIPQERAAEIARLLSCGQWTHDYPILPREAQQLGLRVTVDMPGEVMELMTLYPQPARMQPTVEYLPVKRERPAAPMPAAN